MKTLVSGCTLGAAAAACLFLGATPAADAGKLAPTAPGAAKPRGLVVHEWGTFTSFSGSDGVAVGFSPTSTDLPRFVYRQQDRNAKAAYLAASGTVSMETPVLYFYTEKALRAQVRVDFPRGWITEWYPYAAVPPGNDGKDARAAGQGIRWDIRLLAGETVQFPEGKKEDRYFQARATDAVPLQAEWLQQGKPALQREKFLFYRGVGAFPPPVTVRALGDGKVRITNGSGGRAGGLVLVTVRPEAFGFATLADLEAGAHATAELPKPGKSRAELAEVLVKALTAAGLYAKEARAMVKTWETAWFGEVGTRLLYLVPRKRTDELLKLSIEPKPDAVVRVLVGRHDFLTPEEETHVERQLRRAQAARDALKAAEKELQGLGRFAPQARTMAEKRLQSKAAKK
jgi:hypothetical protein